MFYKVAAAKVHLLRLNHLVRHLHWPDHLEVVHVGQHLGLVDGLVYQVHRLHGVLLWSVEHGSLVSVPLNGV